MSSAAAELYAMTEGATRGMGMKTMLSEVDLVSAHTPYSVYGFVCSQIFFVTARFEENATHKGLGTLVTSSREGGESEVGQDRGRV